LEIIGGHGFPNLPELLGVSFPIDGDNPNGKVVHRKAPFIVADAPIVYKGFAQEPHIQAGIRGWMGVPMLVGDKLIGMIALDKRERGFYTDEHARMAQAFASQAAIAIENAQLFEETKRHIGQLEALRRTTLAITSPLDRKQLLETLVQQSVELLGAKGGGIYEYYPERGELTIIADYGRSKNVIDNVLKIGEGMAGHSSMSLWSSS
jgi:GAF domain-containing protein